MVLSGDPTRVGLQGEVLDEDDYVGTPVVLTRRLCDRAAAGQILACSNVGSPIARRPARASYPLPVLRRGNAG